MTIVPVFLLLLSPWMAGGAFGWLLATKYNFSNGGAWFSLGAGSFLSYVIITGALAVAPSHERDVFACWLSLGCLGGFIVLLSISYYMRSISFMLPKKVARQPLILLPILLLICFIFQIQLVPTAAWDTIEFWALQATNIVRDADAGIFTLFDNYSTKHPSTGLIFIAWITWVGSFANNFDWAWLPWVAIATSIMFMMMGVFLHRFPGHYAFAAFFAYLFLSIPLVENHILLAGYQELFVSGATVISISLVYFFFIRPDVIRLALVFLSSLMPILFKNIGVMYSLSILLTLSVVFCLRNITHEKKLALFFIICLVVAIELVTQTPWVYQLIALALEYDRESNPVVFGGRTMFLSPIDAATLIGVEIHSKIINASFSLSVVAFLVCCRLLWGRSSQSEQLALPLVSCSFVAIGLSILLGSLLLNHALIHALPTSDTGHSRFALPIIALVIFAVIGAVDSAGRK